MSANRNPYPTLTENHLDALWDGLVLALDATEGTNITFMHIREARSYMRDALRVLDARKDVA